MAFAAAHDFGVVILVANEPRAYREALAAELRVWQPLHQIVLGDPARLDIDLQRLSPDAVIASRTTDALISCGRYLLLYPASEDRAVLDVAGASVRVSSPDLQLVLSFLTLLGATS